MLICANCQFANPVDHKFCQRCGSPLAAGPLLQVRLLPFNHLELVPDTYLPDNLPDDLPDDRADASPEDSPKDGLEETGGRYQVSTVLSPGRAYVLDTQAETRSPLQQQLFDLAEADTAPTIETLQSIPELPAAAYPYLLLKDAAPQLYDTWQQGETAIIITHDPLTTTPLIKAFSSAIDPLQPVYWTHLLTDLWAALEPVPQWRSSILQADNLGITADQSLYVHKFTPPITLPYDDESQLVNYTREQGEDQNDADQSKEPSEEPSLQQSAALAYSPQLFELKAFLKSLLAQPHRGEVATLRQIRQLILAVTSAQSLEQLRDELATIGEALLATPSATTPPTSSPLLPASSTFPAPPLSNTQNDMASEDSSIDPLESRLMSDSSEMDESTMVLPMKLLSLEDFGRTDVGRLRDHNEDCFFVASNCQKELNNRSHRFKAHCLYILCDGMGGHDGGEIASQLAAQTLSDYFETHWPYALDKDSEGKPQAATALPDEDTIIAAVKLANQAIYEVNEKEQRAGHERMGTTLVLVLLQGTSAVVAHVGDSRLYQHTRRVGLKQITTDHEVGQREIQRGVEAAIAYERPDAYQLTQALGPRSQESLFPSVTYLNFSEDTLLLLCSDGLSDNNLVENYLDSHIDPILREKKGIVAGMNDLVRLANEVNGHDNITGIAIRLKISPDLQTMAR